MDEKCQERIKLVLYDAMRFGAALGAFGKTGPGIQHYLANATDAAFKAAQDIFMDEVNRLCNL